MEKECCVKYAVGRKRSVIILEVGSMTQKEHHTVKHRGNIKEWCIVKV